MARTERPWFDRVQEAAYHDIEAMNKKQRENTSKLLYDLVRFALVGIIFVNFVPGKEVSWISILAGLIIVAVAYTLAYHLDSRES